MEDMVRGVGIVEDQMQRYGLIMHTGANGVQAKNIIYVHTKYNKDKEKIDKHVQSKGLKTSQVNSDTKEICQKKKGQMTEEQKHKILVQEYSNLPETQSFPLKSGGRLHTTKIFIYLGTQIQFTLRDTYNIDCRITKAG